MTDWISYQRANCRLCTEIDDFTNSLFAEQYPKITNQNIYFERSKIHKNADMDSRQIRKFCELDPESNHILEMAMDRFGLSARAHSRILKISRTIADLEHSPDIRSHHVAEAIQYRSLDRRLIR